MTLICFPLEGGRRSTLRQVDADVFRTERTHSHWNRLHIRIDMKLHIRRKDCRARLGICHSESEVAESSKYDLFNRTSSDILVLSILGRIAAWQILRIPM
jgi:hypothetical protein